MEKNRRMRVAVKISDANHLLLGRLAALHKEPVAVLVRRLLAESLDDNASETNKLALAVRGAIKNTLRPVEEVLAKHAVEAALSAATAMYMGLQCAGDLGVKNALELHDRAWSMAADHVGRGKVFVDK